MCPALKGTPIATVTSTLEVTFWSYWLDQLQSSRDLVLRRPLPASSLDPDLPAFLRCFPSLSPSVLPPPSLPSEASPQL